MNSEATSQIMSLIVDQGEVDIVIATGRDSEGAPGRIFCQHTANEEAMRLRNF